MSDTTPITMWIASCPPDMILELWKNCEKNSQHFDVLVSQINSKLEGAGYTASPNDVKKKCLDIRKGLTNAFERMAKENANDPAILAQIQNGRTNIPRNLTGMGSERANYNDMLLKLSGSMGD